MAKSTDYPSEIRDFGKALGNFKGRFYIYDVFIDFIDYTIACLLLDGCKETADRLKSKYDDEYPKFHSFLICTQKNLASDNDWFDALGMAYEVISSSSKASALGQFFTPKPVCDMMAQITGPLKEVGERSTGLRVNDPACGSGRTLLSFNKVAPGNLLYADDLDGICTKMAAINLALHGCKGQVCNVDSLNPSDWRFGYDVNPRIYTLGGIPNLRLIRMQESETWRHWEGVRLGIQTAKIEPPKPKPKAQPKPIEKIATLDVEAGTQLSLF